MKISIRKVNDAKVAINHVKSSVALPIQASFKINTFIKSLNNSTTALEETIKELYETYKGENGDVKEENIELLNQKIDTLLNEEVELSFEPLSISIFGNQAIPPMDGIRNGQAIKVNPTDFLENFLIE